MAVRGIAAVGCGLVTLLSCTHPSTTPAPGTGAAANTASTRTNTPANAAANDVVAPRRIPPSRDSVAKLRAVYVARVMQQIAGKENQPATQVFKNVQVLKGITAGELVHKMDAEYGTALSWSCTNCHRLADQDNWASDTSANKKRARFMQQMVDEINLTQLPKLYPRDTPKIGCATCHRGYNEPPSTEYLIPERGKPGGLPFIQRGS